MALATAKQASVEMDLTSESSLIIPFTRLMGRSCSNTAGEQAAMFSGFSLHGGIPILPHQCCSF